MTNKNTYLLHCLARSNMAQSLAAKGCSIENSKVLIARRSSAQFLE